MFKQILCTMFVILQLVMGIMLIKISNVYINTKYPILLTFGIIMLALLPLQYKIYTTIINKLFYNDKIEKILDSDYNEILHIKNTYINDLSLTEIFKFIISRNSHDENIIVSCKNFIRQNINYFSLIDD